MEYRIDENIHHQHLVSIHSILAFVTRGVARGLIRQSFDIRMPG